MVGTCTLAVDSGAPSIYHFRHGHSPPYTISTLSSRTRGLRFHYRAADPRRQDGYIPCTHHPSSSLASSVRVGRFHGAILSPTGQHPGLPSLFSTALTSMSAHSWTLVPWLPGRVILNFYRSPEHVTYGLWQGCKGRRENPSRELAFAFPPTARLRCSQVLELLSKAVFLSHFSGCG